MTVAGATTEKQEPPAATDGDMLRGSTQPWADRSIDHRPVVGTIACGPGRI